MIVLSFIIPYYNAEKTIIGTLNSIYSTKIGTDCFEVIIIDDCSDVPLSLLLRDSGINHPNLRIIRHPINKKQGGARNTGIRAAKGDYVAFIDADDRITNNYNCLLPYLLSNDSDIIACRYYKQDREHVFSEVGHKAMSNNDTNIISGKEFCENYLDVATSFIPTCYVFSRHYLLSHYSPFRENIYMEDGDWIAEHLFYANRILILNSCIYEYMYYANSTVHSYTYFHAASWIKTGIRKLQFSMSISNDSPVFASILEKDGRHNIEGVCSRLLKIDRYCLFLSSIRNDLRFLKSLRWSRKASFFFNHPRLSIAVLILCGPLYKSARAVNRLFSHN